MKYRRVELANGRLLVNNYKMGNLINKNWDSKLMLTFVGYSDVKEIISL